MNKGQKSSKKIYFLLNENINPIPDKTHFIKFKVNKPKQTIPKTNLFVSQKIEMSEKDKRHKTKRHIQFIIFKKSLSKAKYTKKSFSDPNINDGIWTEEERDNFIKALILYDTNWKKIKTLIPSRTDTQVRSHAQKFYQRMKLCKDENLGIDFTLKSVKNIGDMINQIKSKCINYNIMFIIKRLLNDCNQRMFLERKKKRNNNRYDNNIKYGKKKKLFKLYKNNNIF